MDDHEDEQDAPDAEESQDDAPPATAAPSTALTPEAVRNSPEFRAMAKQLRNESRARRRIEGEAVRQRAEAETARLAAEAQLEEQVGDQIQAILGDEGVAEWNQISELASTNPVEAARQFAALTHRAAAEAAGGNASQEDEQVPGTQPTTPPVPRTVSASAPLAPASAQENEDAYDRELDQRYTSAVARVQARERLRPRESADAFIAYLERGYRKGIGMLGGKKPIARG